jgi:hypothetical protein
VDSSGKFAYVAITDGTLVSGYTITEIGPIPAAKGEPTIGPAF